MVKSCDWQLSLLNIALSRRLMLLSCLNQGLHPPEDLPVWSAKCVSFMDSQEKRSCYIINCRRPLCSVIRKDETAVKDDIALVSRREGGKAKQSHHFLGMISCIAKISSLKFCPFILSTSSRMCFQPLLVLMNQSASLKLWQKQEVTSFSPKLEKKTAKEKKRLQAST